MALPCRIRCIDCAHCSVSEMMCRPESEKEYKLSQSDLYDYSYAGCDFYDEIRQTSLNN